MRLIGRRSLVIGGLGLIGTGALGYGGSLAACAMRDDRQAMLRPLFVALSDVIAPQRIGDAWLARETPHQVADALLSDPAILPALLKPDASVRRAYLGQAVREDFRAHRIALVGNWVVAESEARIAAAWAADSA